MATAQQTLLDYQSGKITADQYNQYAATGSYSTAPTTSTATAPSNVADLTNAQRVQYGYSSIEGQYNSATGAMTPQSLSPATPFPLVSAAASPTPNISALNPADYQMTSQEQLQHDQGSLLQKIQNSLIGKSADTAQAYEQGGVNSISQAIRNNNTTVLRLQAEAAAIPLQLQQGAADRGVTTTQLGRQENSRLRTNAIAALSASAIGSALQNDMLNAKDAADRAIAAKYGPIEAQRDALMANLNIIRNDPLTTLQDRQRADAQTARQADFKAADALAKANATEVWGIATTAAQNGANFKPMGQYTDLSVTLQAISQAPTKEMALAIASSVGLIAPAAGTSGSSEKILGNSTSGYYTYNSATGQTTAIANPNPTSSTSPTGSTSSTAVKFTATQFNSGAAKAGLTLDAFKALPPDVQNYFVNTSATSISAIQSLFSEVQSGAKTSASVTALIDSANISQPVKDYWKAKLATITTTTTSSGGFLSNLWGGIKGLIGL